ncbi:hypothetical protein [Alicyclobacillus kakegawensis]|uniref:hypothetical protein n=1 Tax=Alicyclobacillus kakegawensis TaxID=392012 RepID=UPI00083351E2|nr:hypothetical protein [Alicyclobacillus kakegawensis]
MIDIHCPDCGHLDMKIVVSKTEGNRIELTSKTSLTNHTNKVLDALLEMVERERIHLCYMRLTHEKRPIMGLNFFDTGRGSFIILDESVEQDDVMHIAVLAEELGHHFKTSTNMLKDDTLTVLEGEVDALRWAVTFLASHIVREATGSCRQVQDD